MSNIKTLSVLAGAAAVAITAVVWTLGAQSPQQASLAVDKTLLPGLAQSLDQINAVRVVTAGAATAVELVPTVQGWAVANKHHYPAAISQVRATLQALAGARVVEEKTANPEYYARLGVEDVSQPDAGGVQLELAGLAAPVALVIGNLASSGTGTYVRRSDAAQSLLVDTTLTVDTDPLDWLDRRVLDIPAERIQQVTIRQPDGATLTVRKDTPEAANYTLVDLPAGREPGSALAVDQVAGALADVQLDDVTPASALSPAEGASVNAEFRTFDGLVITARAFQQEGTGYVQFTAAYAGAEPTAVQQEAEQLQARLADWVYALPDYQYGPLTRRMEDVLAPLADAATD